MSVMETAEAGQSVSSGCANYRLPQNEKRDDPIITVPLYVLSTNAQLAG
jgi:hypothetical protein